jgi:hypothetical protein
VIGVHTPEFKLRRIETTFAVPRKAYASTSPSMTVMRYCLPSTTGIGERRISSMCGVAFDVAILARAATNSQEWSFKNYWPRRERATRDLVANVVAVACTAEPSF